MTTKIFLATQEAQKPLAKPVATRSHVVEQTASQNCSTTTRMHLRKAKKDLTKQFVNEKEQVSDTQENNGLSEIEKELEALAQLQVFLVKLENQFSQGQIKISDANTQATIAESKKMIQKVHDAQKKLEEAKRKQKQMGILGIVVSVLGCLLAALAGVEAVVAVAAMVALQYSGAMDKMTKNMSDGEKIGVSVGLSIAFALATGGLSAASFTQVAGEEAGAQAADEAAQVAVGEERTLVQRIYDVFRYDQPTTTTQAAAQGARFGAVTGFMGTLTLTGVLQKEISKLCGHDTKGEVLSMLLMITIAMMAIALAGAPSAQPGGILGQMEAQAAEVEANTQSAITASIMRSVQSFARVLRTMTEPLKPLMVTATIGAEIARGTMQIQIGQIQKNRADMEREMATIQKNLLQLRFTSTMLKNIQSIIDQSLKTYAKAFANSVENLNGFTKGFEALIEVLRMQSRAA